MQKPVAVLHVGWMPRAVAALIAAGANVTCAVAPADAVAARAAGAATVVVPQPSQVEGVLSGLARDGLALADYDVICSVLEFCLVPAAVLQELAGRSQGAALRTLAMRDKYVQKQLVRGAGVPAATSEVLESLAAADPAALTFPKVLKPLDGGGARHTYVLTDEKSARECMALAAVGGEGPWLLEEYIDGTEFQVDGLVRNGEIKALSVSRYLQNLIEVHEGGMVAHVALPPAEYPRLYEEIRDVAETSFKALEYQDGPFHLEVFQETAGGRIVFGECAARVGGGRTDDVMELAFGVNLRSEWARLMLGSPSALAAPASHTTEGAYGGMNLPAPAGRVLAMPGLDEVLARPGVVRAQFDIAPGQVMPDVTAASHLRAGLAVVRGADDSEVTARMRDLADWFAGSVEVAPTVTE
ncbi:ATP-grasp domain-containing protein [Streptomyces sp. NPDC008125]|uniref:ATP-grasp domain-containing protein n=1 Tax=Streptomyces sp. NPDC008125 TaxID=3364811 RepID=UPI0036E06BFA